MEMKKVLILAAVGAVGFVALRARAAVPPAVIENAWNAWATTHDPAAVRAVLDAAGVQNLPASAFAGRPGVDAAWVAVGRNYGLLA
jgi:hypothetical protein